MMMSAPADLDRTDEDDFGDSDLENAPEEHFAQHIADAQHVKADLESVADSQKQLNSFQQGELLEALKKLEDLFQRNLGTWPNAEMGATLIGGTTPCHCQKPMRTPHAHHGALKKEIDRLVSTGVPEEADGNTAGTWCSPSFVTDMNKKDGTVRFITDCKEVNRRIARKPWPMPHTADLSQDIGRHFCLPALALSMDCCHFKSDNKLQDMSAFVLPWGLCKHLQPPMGLSISPDLFQANMQMLLADLPFVKVHLDDVLIFCNGSHQDHMKKVKQVLERLRSKNSAVNARKSFWAVKEAYHLGFMLTPK